MVSKSRRADGALAARPELWLRVHGCIAHAGGQEHQNIITFVRYAFADSQFSACPAGHRKKHMTRAAVVAMVYGSISYYVGGPNPQNVFNL